MDLVKLIVILFAALAIILGLRSVTTSTQRHTAAKRKSKRRTTTRNQVAGDSSIVEFDIAPNRKMMTYAIQLNKTLMRQQVTHVFLEVGAKRQDITVFFNDGQGNGLTRDSDIIMAAVNKTLLVHVVTKSGESTIKIA